MEPKNIHSKSIFYILLFISIIIGAAVLKITSNIFIPITVALLLSFVFYPMLKKLNQKLHFPWIVSIMLVLVLSIIVFTILGNLIFSSIKKISSVYPKYEDRFWEIYMIFAKAFKITVDEDSSLLANLWNSLKVRNTVQSAAISLSSSLLSFTKNILLIVLYVVFLLLEMKTLRKKADKALDKSASGKFNIITSNIINETTHYISIKFLISLFTGILVFISTLAVGIEFPIIWGFAAFILNFIPTFGSIISWGATTLFAILQFYPSWPKVIIVSVLILAVNMILGNIIEPRWEGSDLGLSPFVILISLAVWGWIWGPIGMILAVPLMVIIKIICENVSYLEKIAIFLGNGK